MVRHKKRGNESCRHYQIIHVPLAALSMIEETVCLIFVEQLPRPNNITAAEE